jgi:hypothetical protein
MPDSIQRRRGTTAEHASFTGAVGEITIDTDKKIVVVHDGSTVGGHPSTNFNHGTLSYASTVNLDMSTLAGLYRTISLTGNLTFTTSNRAAGRIVVLRLICDATQRNLTFPADWKFIGTKPSNIAASKTGILTLTFFGSTDADCIAAYGVQG